MMLAFVPKPAALEQTSAGLSVSRTAVEAARLTVSSRCLPELVTCAQRRRHAARTVCQQVDDVGRHAPPVAKFTFRAPAPPVTRRPAGVQRNATAEVDQVDRDR